MDQLVVGEEEQTGEEVPEEVQEKDDVRCRTSPKEEHWTRWEDGEHHGHVSLHLHDRRVYTLLQRLAAAEAKKWEAEGKGKRKEKEVGQQGARAEEDNQQEMDSRQKGEVRP